MRAWGPIAHSLEKPNLLEAKINKNRGKLRTPIIMSYLCLVTFAKETLRKFGRNNCQFTCMFLSSIVESSSEGINVPLNVNTEAAVLFHSSSHSSITHPSTASSVSHSTYNRVILSRTALPASCLIILNECDNYIKAAIRSSVPKLVG